MIRRPPSSTSTDPLLPSTALFLSRLVKEGRDVADIAVTFGLPDLTIARVLALGNLLPRVRSLYAAEKIDRATVRHLTLTSKSQQRAWLALYEIGSAHV